MDDAVAHVNVDRPRRRRSAAAAAVRLEADDGAIEPVLTEFAVRRQRVAVEGGLIGGEHVERLLAEDDVVLDHIGGDGGARLCERGVGRCEDRVLTRGEVDAVGLEALHEQIKGLVAPHLVLFVAAFGAIGTPEDLRTLQRPQRRQYLGARAHHRQRSSTPPPRS